MRELSKKLTKSLMLILLWHSGFDMDMNIGNLIASTKKPLSVSKKSNLEDVLKNYVIVADLQVKEETRKISDYIFWRYKIVLPKEDFDMRWLVESADDMLPVTPGTGREYEHANLGRSQYLGGDYLIAINTWLALKKFWGKDFPYAKRIDYFIGRAYLALAAEELKKNPGKKFYEIVETLKPHLLRASTFLESTWIVSERVKDDKIDNQRALSLYNLAVMAYAFEKYSRAFTMSELALEEIVKTGDTSLRPDLRRLRAEILIYTQDYMGAFKELDLGIRQDPSSDYAPLMLARIADIYFNFNNYELAEDMYAQAARVESDNERVNLARQVVRGEALFWMGRFDDTQKIMQAALDMEPLLDKQNDFTEEHRRIAVMRIADSYLAKNMFEAAKLAYYKAGHNFRGDWVEQVAKVRSYCLELPQYDGQNIVHGREGLETLKNLPEIPLEARELAWTCQIASILDHESNQEMIDKALVFAKNFPESKIVSRFAESFVKVKSVRLGELFASGKFREAIDFYEKKKDDFYKTLNENDQTSLFYSYVKVHQSEKASEFFTPKLLHSKISDENLLLLGVFVSELSDKKENQLGPSLKSWIHSKLLATKWTLKESAENRVLMNRSLFADESLTNSLWSLNLARTWAGNEMSKVCETYFPMASKLLSLKDSDLSMDTRKSVEAEIITLVDVQLPQYLESDETCSLSLLEQEFSILKKEPSKLVNRFLNRKSWNLSPDLLSLFMRVATLASDAGLAKESRQIWQVVLDKAPDKSAESSIARTALNQENTRFDSIWK